MTKTKFKIRELAILTLVLIPLTSVIQSFPGAGMLNKILITLFIILQSLHIFKKIKKFGIKNLLLVSIVLISITKKIMDSTLSENLSPFYFLFTCILLCICTYEPMEIIDGWKKNKKIIDLLILIWCVIVSISFFMPSSWKVVGDTWGTNRYFYSFTVEGGARLGTIAFLETIIIEYQYILYKKNRYLVCASVPILTAFLSGNRTCILMIAVSILLIVYSKIKNDKKFLLLCSVMLPLMALVLWRSSFGEKTQMVLQYGWVSNDYSPILNFINLITNHRIDFIAEAFSTYKNSSFFEYLLGVSSIKHDVYDDITGVLLNVGIIALCIYFVYISQWLRSIKKSNNPWYINACVIGCFVIAFIAQSFFMFVNEAIGICLMGVMLHLIKNSIRSYNMNFSI